MCLQVAGSTTSLQSCPLCSLASVQFLCAVVPSAVLPVQSCILCTVVPCVISSGFLLRLISHVQSCLCSKWSCVQYCHVFNRDLWVMIPCVQYCFLCNLSLCYLKCTCAMLRRAIPYKHRLDTILLQRYIAAMCALQHFI